MAEMYTSENATNCGNITHCQPYTVEYYGYLYIYTPIAICGIVLNSINLAILTRPIFRSYGTTFTYLHAMALADLVSLSIFCPIGITRCTPESHDWQTISRQVYEIYLYLPIGNTFATTSVWLTTIVAVERYITITNTALSRSLCTKYKAERFIIVIFISSFLIHIPYLFYRKVSADGTYVYTAFGESQEFQIYCWIRNLFAKYLPIVIVISFNLLLLYHVCQSNRKMKNLVFPESALQRRQQKQNKCTAMLLGITITFLLCHMMEPFIHSSIYQSLFGACSLLEYTYRNLVMIVNTLETTSFASNFIFYYLFNKDFAKILGKCFLCEGTQTSGCCVKKGNSKGSFITNKGRTENKSEMEQITEIKL